MPSHLDRHDQSTWRGDHTDCDGTQSISVRYGKVKLRDDVWGNETLDELTTRNEDVFRMVEQLLGPGNVVPPDRFRGLYSIFPTPEHRHVPVHAHVDATKVPFKVSIAAYLQDVPVHGGGFTVWPGSHRTLFYDCITDASSQENLETKSFRRHFYAIDRTEPVEISGHAGDVVFFHYCLMPAECINLIPGHVRQAVLCNYSRSTWERDRSSPRPDNIWHGWDGILGLDSPIIRESMSPLPAPLAGKRSKASIYANFHVSRLRNELLRILDKISATIR